MYYYGIYSSVNAFSTHFDDDVKKKYAIWVAHWYVNKPSFNGKWGCLAIF